MRVLISRVNNASVKVNNKIVGKIDKGLLVLSCYTANDSIKEIEYIKKKVLNLRIFEDENNIMNKSILDVNGKILSISQFTLYADTKKGNRPSYIKALPSNESKILYDLFNEKLKEDIEVETGIFGEDMKIDVAMDGPVNIIIDSK